MTAKATVDQTPTGWRVVATGADYVRVETNGASIRVTVEPDEPEPPAKPLDVALAPS